MRKAFLLGISCLALKKSHCQSAPKEQLATVNSVSMANGGGRKTNPTDKVKGDFASQTISLDTVFRIGPNGVKIKFVFAAQR